MGLSGSCSYSTFIDLFKDDSQQIKRNEKGCKTFHGNQRACLLQDPKTENNPYLGFVYATFVERATFLSHRVLANRAQELGDPHLAKICGTVAGDEKRHELAYGRHVPPFSCSLCIEKGQETSGASH